MKLMDFLLKDKSMPKILVTNNHSTGINMIWDATKEVGSSFHVSAWTLAQLAENYAKDFMIEHDIRLIDAKEGLHLIYTILHRYNANLPYFSIEQCTIDLARELYQTIQELKHHRITPPSEDLSPKLQTIFSLIVFYKDELKMNNLWDEADLLEHVLHNEIAAKASIHFGVLSNLELSTLEKDFLQKLTQQSFDIISLPVPTGEVSLPKSYDSTLQDNETHFHHPILNVYGKERLASDQIHVFKAYGVTNEVNYVLQDVLKRRIPFDDVVILYTDSHYAELIHHTGEQLGIPVTFGSGLGITASKSFHFIKEFCQYIQNGYKITDMKSMFLEGSIKLFDDNDSETEGEKPQKVSTGKLFDFLLKEKIGWGLKRTIEKLSSKITEEDAATTKHRYQALLSFFENVHKHVNHTNPEKTDFHQLVSGLLSISEQYIQTAGFQMKNEQIAKRLILTELRRMLEFPNMELSLDEAIARILTQLEGVTRNASSETPGHVHADLCEQVGYLTRKQVYVIGLDSKRFPKPINESPILTDEERAALSPTLLKSIDFESYKRYKLLEVLGSTTGNITLGYSYYDTSKVRENNPSTFIYQVLERLGLKESEIEDYGFVAKNEDDVAGTLGAYLHAWVDDEAKAQSIQLKEKHELGHAKPKVTDFVLSATALERMAECNRKFYYRDVLKIQKKEEMEHDISKWLPGNELGLLYHKIFEKYVKVAIMNGEKIAIETFVEEAFRHAREQIPSPTEDLYQAELKRALEVSKRFAARINGEMKQSGFEPVGVEQEIPELEITLNKGQADERSFKIKAFIDRIDKLDETTYRIVDYKTGKKKRFEDYKEDKLQHYLYKLAFEEWMKETENKDVQVVEAIYDFPLEEGHVTYQDEDLLKTTTKKIEFDNQEKLVDLLKRIEEGSTEPASNKKYCEYCDYKSICRINE